ncbi:hypothetical protein [Sphingomonas sp. SRS2]|uniref:hypothetical protein n=1 Tax=Sphingomonas sp. SRS2 TaxID=133190 RepID=UPI001F47DAC8|nr:hypothetical protein [Sphingomonas sp. SRS2]
MQLLMLLAAFGMFAFAPPVRGAMLLVPLTTRARADLPGLAVRRGALLLGQGPVAGSLLVRGERARLGTALLRRGIVLIAAPEIICGSTAPQGQEA